MAEDATAFWFGSGHVALDLSLSGGADWRSRWERLHRPTDLDAWLAECALGVDGVRSSQRDLVLAQDLREGLWETTQALASGEPMPEAAVATLNEHAGRPPLRRQLRVDRTCVWDGPTARAALATIATSAIELLSADVATSGLRRCEGERCHLLFVDTSPARRRRWCSMERCGNRHKVRTHRARQRQSRER